MSALSIVTTFNAYIVQDRQYASVTVRVRFLLSFVTGWHDFGFPLAAEVLRIQGSPGSRTPFKACLPPPPHTLSTQMLDNTLGILPNLCQLSQFLLVNWVKS